MGEIVLSIESGVAGGSLALHRDGELVSSWANPDPVSRSEGLLSEIGALLEKTGIAKNALKRIAVSIGPGSYTGIRIGIATAMGLSKALGIPSSGIPLLKAIANGAAETGPVLAAVPIGRNGLCWQSFEGILEGRTAGAIETGTLDEFHDFLDKPGRPTALLHSGLFEAIVGSKGPDSALSRVKDIGRHLAVQIGLAPGSLDEGLVPIYAREMKFPTLTGENIVR